MKTDWTKSGSTVKIKALVVDSHIFCQEVSCTDAGPPVIPMSRIQGNRQGQRDNHGWRGNHRGGDHHREHHNNRGQDYNSRGQDYR